MVARKHPGMHPQAPSSHSLEKEALVIVIQEDPFQQIAQRHYIIIDTAILDAKTARHAQMVA